MTLNEVPFQTVAPFSRVAALEGVSVKPGVTENTCWFAASIDGKLRGFCGVIRLGEGRYRFKGAWVLPESRGEGVYTFMRTTLHARLLADGADYIEAITRSPWVKRLLGGMGFVEVGKVRGSSVRLAWRRTP